MGLGFGVDRHSFCGFCQLKHIYMYICNVGLTMLHTVDSHYDSLVIGPYLLNHDHYY